MKQGVIAFVSALLSMALFCGCDKPTENTNSNKGTLFLDFVGDYPENPIPILTSSEEEIRRIINEQPNLICSDSLYVMAPESASVYEFTDYSVHVPLFDYPAKQYQKDFEETFKYFFPNKEIDPEYLKYKNYDSETYEWEYGYVKDKQELSDGVCFTYDETPERPEIWNDPVYLELADEIGGGSALINKGEATRLVGKTEVDLYDNSVSSNTYNRLSDFEPTVYFKTIAEYSPKSKKSYKLLDGEVKICDAVEHFESYINNAPISTGLERNCRTEVYSVQVLRVDNDTYGYYFHTLQSFQGVSFEPVVYGSKSPYDYDGVRGEALMIRSDDVDYIHQYFGSDWTADVKACKSIVPFEAAIKNISDKVSKVVRFEVRTVEFVYVRYLDKDEYGHINIDTYEGRVTPAWRVTMYNPNDNLMYVCYVDAKDGGNFRYFWAKGIVNITV